MIVDSKCLSMKILLQPKQKRQKVDRRDLPENNVFVCETCDRGFKTEELYSTHLNGHVKVVLQILLLMGLFFCNIRKLELKLITDINS